MGYGAGVSNSSHSVSLWVRSFLPAPLIKTCWKRVRSIRVQRVTLTPIPNSLSLFRTSIEHGRDNQKTCNDTPFAHAKDQANYKQARKVFAGGMAAQRDSPDSDVKAGNIINDHSNASRKIKADLIHFPTGNRCKHKFCGYSKTR